MIHIKEESKQKLLWWKSVKLIKIMIFFWTKLKEIMIFKKNAYLATRKIWTPDQIPTL